MALVACSQKIFAIIYRCFADNAEQSRVSVSDWRAATAYVITRIGLSC